MFLAYKDLVVYLSVTAQTKKAVNFFLSNLLAMTYIYKLLETDNLHPWSVLVVLPKFRSGSPVRADLLRDDRKEATHERILRSRRFQLHCGHAPSAACRPDHSRFRPLFGCRGNSRH